MWKKNNHNRAINRHRWYYPELLEKLADPSSQQAIVFAQMKQLIAIRIRQPAFHPNATQYTLQLGDRMFGFWRQSRDRSQSIFAIHNVTDETVSIPTRSLNLFDGENWKDLVSGQQLQEFGVTSHLYPIRCAGSPINKACPGSPCIVAGLPQADLTRIKACGSAVRNQAFVKKPYFTIQSMSSGWRFFTGILADQQ